jgi:hypothetical protein
MSYANLELNVIHWGEKRGIVQNSNPMAQAIKSHEELGELMTAIQRGDRAAMADGYGDLLVTIILGCATADLDVCECLAGAYNEIKNRRGYLDEQGIFHKEA